MSLNNTLVVFAHKDEASAFQDVPHLITGVGKVNAATALAKELCTALSAGTPYSRVIVLGTAGIIDSVHDLDTVVQVTAAVQHDFSLESPKLSLGGAVIGATATIATGDVFVKDDTQKARIAELGATLVDMEVYAYAQTARTFATELLVFKVPSDFADSNTTDKDWDEIVFLKSQQLRQFYDEVLPNI